MRLLLLVMLSWSLGCKSETQNQSEAVGRPRAEALSLKATGPLPFIADIERFEQMDEASPVAPGSVVFTGSSSIRRWTTLA
ncbi:MAG: hypothetical protein GY811_29845, partial [Myxococcales bacterium]|nr:hypothetical protein [Myxococcales bacterium]